MIAFFITEFSYLDPCFQTGLFISALISNVLLDLSQPITRASPGPSHILICKLQTIPVYWNLGDHGKTQAMAWCKSSFVWSSRSEVASGPPRNSRVSSVKAGPFHD